jgi:hypothetical protein
MRAFVVTRCGSVPIWLMLAGCVPDLAGQCAGNADCPAERPVCVAAVCTRGDAAPADAAAWDPLGADRLTGEADAAPDLSLGAVPDAAAPDAGSAAPDAASPPADPPKPPEKKDHEEKEDAGGHHHGHDHGHERDG